MSKTLLEVSLSKYEPLDIEILNIYPILPVCLFDAMKSISSSERDNIIFGMSKFSVMIMGEFQRKDSISRHLIGAVVEGSVINKEKNHPYIVTFGLHKSYGEYKGPNLHDRIKNYVAPSR